MSKYNVGESVWVTTENRYGLVTDIEDTPQGIFIHIDNRHSYAEHLIHATFDTMITRLGFEKYENDVLIQYDKKTETTLGNKTVSIRIIKGKKDYMIWTTDDYIAKMPYGQKIIITNINHELHEALTQLMRELKANEIWY